MSIVLPLSITPKDDKSVFPAFSSRDGHRELMEEAYTHLTEWLRTGFIKPTPLEVQPGGLGGIIGGLKKLENGQVSGTKLVAHPQDPPIAV